MNNNSDNQQNIISLDDRRKLKTAMNNQASAGIPTIKLYGDYWSHDCPAIKALVQLSIGDPCPRCGKTDGGLPPCA